MTPGEGDAVTQVIERYTPRGTSAAAARFAKEVTAAAGPTSPTRAKALLYAACRLGAFGEQVGLDLSPEVLLCPSVIERVCHPTTTAMSAPTRRTLRSNLRAIARAVSPGPPAVALACERAKAPYTRAEIACYLALADAQGTEARRQHASALVCLGAGAGLVGTDLKGVRGTDVVARSGGVVVDVRQGRCARVVPVLARYHERLLRAAGLSGERLLIGGTSPQRRNVTTPLTSALCGGSDLPRLDICRLRATWLVEVAATIGLRAFMDAAGIVCSQRLGDLVGHLEPADEVDTVVLLWGAALSRAQRQRTFAAILARAKVAEHLGSSMPSGGRPGQLTPTAVLMGMLCAMDQGRPAHLVAGCEALYELSVQDQVHLGVLRTVRGTLHPASYRQFSHTHQVMTRAIDPTPVPGLRGVAVEDRAAHFDARSAGVDHDAATALRNVVLDAVVEASVPDAYTQASSSLAVDWTDYETWSRPRAKDDSVPPSDPTAWWGHAKGTAPGEKEHLFFGYYAQVASMVPDEHGPRIPELVRRAPFAAPPSADPARQTPASADPAKEMATALVRAYDEGVPPGDVLCDCGYSNRDPDTFAAPLRRRGAGLVMDLHPSDRGQKSTYKGAILANGNLYCPCTPTALLALGPLGRGATDEQTAAHDAKSAELARYKLGRVSKDDQYGQHRVMCPAAMGKIRCPLLPESMARPYTRPEVLSVPEHPPACCTHKTITVEAPVNAKTAQKHDYPSKAHRLSFNRRTGAERTFGWLKDPATTGITRGWCRLTGRTKNALMFTLAVVVRNVRLVETFERDQAAAARRAAMGLEPLRRRRRHRDTGPAPSEPEPTKEPAAPG